MTDREMLELAAKAAGLVVVRSRLDDPAVNDFLIRDSARNQHQTLGPWSPLTDDGDCARMEAALGIDVRWGFYVYNTDGSEEQIGVICGDYHGTLNAVEPYGADKQAARRLASTRVAAMMGEAMP
jgi:hypothetical protein